MLARLERIERRMDQHVTRALYGFGKKLSDPVATVGPTFPPLAGERNTPWLSVSSSVVPASTT